MLHHHSLLSHCPLLVSQLQTLLSHTPPFIPTTLQWCPTNTPNIPPLTPGVPPPTFAVPPSSPDVPPATEVPVASPLLPSIPLPSHHCPRCPLTSHHPSLLSHQGPLLPQPHPLRSPRTFTLKVMASMTKMRSGKMLATSSTLLKYCTGSRRSRSWSSSLNFPAGTPEPSEVRGARLLTGTCCHPPGTSTALHGEQPPLRQPGVPTTSLGTLPWASPVSKVLWGDPRASPGPAPPTAAPGGFWVGQGTGYTGCLSNAARHPQSCRHPPKASL